MPASLSDSLSINLKRLKLTVIFLVFPLFFYAQTLTGLWTGILSNDSNTVRKDQSFEIVLTEYRGKVYGYSRSEFIVNDTLYYILKRVKGTIEGDMCEVKDDEIISYNFPTRLDKGIKITSTFYRNKADSTWYLAGTWKTNQTKNYYAVTGRVDLAEEKDLNASKIFPHLEELKLADDVAFYKDRKTGIHIVRIAKPEKNLELLSSYKVDEAIQKAAQIIVPDVSKPGLAATSEFKKEEPVTASNESRADIVKADPPQKFQVIKEPSIIAEQAMIKNNSPTTQTSVVSDQPENIGAAPDKILVRSNADEKKETPSVRTGAEEEDIADRIKTGSISKNTTEKYLPVVKTNTTIQTGDGPNFPKTIAADPNKINKVVITDPTPETKEITLALTGKDEDDPRLNLSPMTRSAGDSVGQVVGQIKSTPITKTKNDQPATQFSKAMEQPGSVITVSNKNNMVALTDPSSEKKETNTPAFTDTGGEVSPGQDKTGLITKNTTDKTLPVVKTNTTIQTFGEPKQPETTAAVQNKNNSVALTDPSLVKKEKRTPALASKDNDNPPLNPARMTRSAGDSVGQVVGKSKPDPITKLIAKQNQPATQISTEVEQPGSVAVIPIKNNTVALNNPPREKKEPQKPALSGKDGDHQTESVKITAFSDPNRKPEQSIINKQQEVNPKSTGAPVQIAATKTNAESKKLIITPGSVQSGTLTSKTPVVQNNEVQTTSHTLTNTDGKLPVKAELVAVASEIKKPAPDITQKAAVIAGRKTEFSQIVNFKSDSLELSLYDNGEIDGDTVSVYMNGEVFWANQGLKATAIKKTIYLPPGNNDEFTLVMFAENLGKYPPNTGLLVVHDGQDVYNLRFSSDFKMNAGIVFRRKK